MENFINSLAYEFLKALIIVLPAFLLVLLIQRS